MASAQVKIFVRDKEISLAEFGEGSRRESLENMIEQFQAAIGSLKCSIHRKPPTLVFKGEDTDNLMVGVQGCCQKLRDKVIRKLAKTQPITRR